VDVDVDRADDIHHGPLWHRILLENLGPFRPPA